jgi:hypothetical protein
MWVRAQWYPHGGDRNVDGAWYSVQILLTLNIFIKTVPLNFREAIFFCHLTTFLDEDYSYSSRSTSVSLILLLSQALHLFLLFHFVN